MKYILNGAIHYDAGTFFLRKEGEKIFLNPGAGRALAFLVVNPGRECRKDELVEEIWGKHGFIVGSNSLNQIIVQLRKAFHSIDPSREYIVTIPRVGYKLVADVQSAEAPAQHSGPGGDGVGTSIGEVGAEKPRLAEGMRLAVQSIQQLGKASLRVLDKVQGLLASVHFVLAFLICSATAFAFDGWVTKHVDPVEQSFSGGAKVGQIWHHALRSSDPRSESNTKAAFDRYLLSAASHTRYTHVYPPGEMMKTSYLPCRGELSVISAGCATPMSLSSNQAPTI